MTQRAIDVFRYLDYRLFLADYYRAGKGRGFSYRNFSRAAGLRSPNYLKLIIEGQRNLTAEMAERFAAACRLKGDAAEYFVELVRFSQAANVAPLLPRPTSPFPTRHPAAPFALWCSLRARGLWLVVLHHTPRDPAPAYVTALARRPQTRSRRVAVMSA